MSLSSGSFVAPSIRLRARSLFGTLLVVAVLSLAVAWPAIRADNEGAPIGSAVGAATFRGGPERTGEMPGPGPVSGVRLLWRVPTGLTLNTAPVVAGETVYYAAAGQAFAVGRVSGRIVWQVETDDDLVTPAVAGDLVILGGSDVSVLDAATGRERWSFSAPGAVYGAPAVVDGVVYVASTGPSEGTELLGGRLFALDASDGKVRWQTELAGYRASAPTVAGGVVYLRDDAGQLYAFDAATGAERWRRPLGAYEALPGGVAIAGGLLYAVGHWPGDNPEEPDLVVLALDAVSGQERWRVVAPETSSFVGSSPAVVDGTLYVGLGRSLHAFDAVTGEERWRFATEWDAGDPSVAGGVVYLTTQFGGALIAVDAATGLERWRFQTIENLMTNPVVLDEIVYLATINYDAGDGFLYAFWGLTESPAPASPVAGSEPAATPNQASPVASPPAAQRRAPSAAIVRGNHLIA